MIGKPVNVAIKPVLELLEHHPKAKLSAFRQKKNISLDLTTFDKNNAKKLYDITNHLINGK